VGSNGQVGQSLLGLGECFDFEIVGYDLPCIDMTKMESLRAAFQKESPNLVINAAAYTAVDKAEEQAVLAYAVNDLGTKNLALVCKEQGLTLFHISTDYVFDGAEGMYNEESRPNPLGIYGKSKLAGEVSLKATYENHVILRTCWVFSEFGGNFVKTMVRLAKERDQLGVVADQFGGPTSARQIAQALLQLSQKHFSDEKIYGTYHLSGEGFTNWAEFAREIFIQAKKVGLIKSIPEVKDLKTKEYPVPAPRPKDSRLDCTKIKALIPEIDQDWQSELKRVLKVLRKTEQ
jgi:dTDP-4-dehydrorhamnose reductase